MKLDPNDPVDRFLAAVPRVCREIIKITFRGKDLEGHKVPWAFRGFFISVFLLTVLQMAKMILVITMMASGQPVPDSRRPPIVIPKPVMIAP